MIQVPHTDITTPEWFEALPPKARPYALLMRLDRPIGTWLLLLPGWWALSLSGSTDLLLYVLFSVGAIIMRGAGCVVNDLWDRDFDARVVRTQNRPLVTGAVSQKQAFVFLAGLLACGAAILFAMSGAAIALGILSLFFIVAYPLMKRITWWPQAFLGLTFNFGALMGWAASTGTLAPAALLLYAGGIAWTLGYDTIYAHQDRDDDALIGIRSTARLFGARSKQWIAGFYGLALIGFAASFALAGIGIIGLSLLIVPVCHFAWQVWRWDMNTPTSSLRMFRANRDLGLWMWLVIIVAKICGL